MLMIVLIAVGLVGATVIIHAAGLSAVIRVAMSTRALDRSGFAPVTGMLIALACWLILLNLVEISVWALFYLWQGCLPDAESAFYFSGVTFTSVGYGDLVLAKPWRMLSPLEALAGLLMHGVSTGLFFAFISKWVINWIRRNSA